MVLRATSVFTPGSFPEHTYVTRNDLHLEQAVRQALDTPGQVVSISGPSKSGKTVMVEHVAGRDNLITVTGAGIRSPELLWERILDWMDAPTSESKNSERTNTVGLELKAEGAAKVPFVASGAVAASGGVETARSDGAVSSYERRGMRQIVNEIANSAFVVLIDDFHYMPRNIQTEVAKQLKELVRQGVKVCAAAVAHRGDDAVRANPELQGRVRAIDLEFWSISDLKRIAELGFEKLNVELPERVIERFAAEAAGSPQLMQQICLSACFNLDIEGPDSTKRLFDPDDKKLRRILEQTSSTTNFRSLVDILDSGPKTRGTERKMYKFFDGTEGDVYRCVLKSVTSDPPRLSLDYSELTKRVAKVCETDPPIGSSVITTCHHMSKLALEKFPDERVIDWDEQKQILDIPDPYLLFYLRWSGRLMEAN